MGLCDKITAGFDICANDAIAPGIEDLLYVCNKGDFTFTYDPTNPLLITGITAVTTGNKFFKFTGSNNSFSTNSKSKRTNVGPRFTEEIDFNIAGLSSDIKKQISQMGYGKVQVIAVNNYRDEDSIFELFGATSGLMLDTAERKSTDETYEGGYNIKLTAPPKLSEPYMPRCINVPPVGSGSPPATFASTLAAIEALCI